MRNIFILFLFLCVSTPISSQEISNILSLEEYLGYVKNYHPIVKQAELTSSKGEIKLLKARGAFDPKLETEYSRKKFKNIEYYDKLNATFKIPVWYGVALKANYENNDGEFLNPELSLPEEGLYSAGLSLSLAKGLLINERMAALKQAKLFRKQLEAQQRLMVNDILYEAIDAYFKWLKNYESKIVYESYLTNADIRLKNIKKSFFAGEKPAVDTLEASINYKNRVLELEKANITAIKSTLKLSNFLWLNNNLPLELKPTVIPDVNTLDKIDNILSSSLLNFTDNDLQNHPKIQELEVKKQILQIEKRLNKNNLLPTINLEYNFLTPDYNNINSLNSSNYKSGLRIYLQLFLRKERAKLKLTKLKLQSINFDISATKLSLKNKVESHIQNITSYEKQYGILVSLSKDYDTLLYSEERKFNLGESSIFLINYREVKCIENKLKQIDTGYQFLLAKLALSRTLNNI